MKQRRNPIFFSFLLLLFVACGTQKKASKTGALTDNLKTVIKKHEASEPDFKTVQGNLKASYEDSDQSQSVSVSFRIEKDKKIWMSAKLAGLIPLAKVMITPDHVQYYEKINGTYFDGDFSLLSKWLNTELDFQKVQNLLLGQAIYEPSRNYDFNTTEKAYVLSWKDSVAISKFFKIEPLHYRMEAQQLVREHEHQSVTVTYPAYQEVSGYVFPKEINIIANEKEKNTKINITYRALEFNVPVSFPFHIPSGYDEIKIP